MSSTAWSAWDSRATNAYWGRAGLDRAIVDALTAAGKDISALTIDDLARVARDPRVLDRVLYRRLNGASTDLATPNCLLSRAQLGPLRRRLSSRLDRPGRDDDGLRLSLLGCDHQDCGAGVVFLIDTGTFVQQCLYNRGAAAICC